MQVLYFTAPWCAPCKMFKPIVETASGELGVNINYINVDYDASFAERYSVTSVPTLIILDGQGQVAYRNSGVMSKDQLSRVLNQFK
jgi:thiol-disulfide isomerase/thioredoxin